MKAALRLIAAYVAGIFGTYTLVIGLADNYVADVALGAVLIYAARRLAKPSKPENRDDPGDPV